MKYLGGSDGLPSCTLSKMGSDSFLRDSLLNKQLKIEIWALAESRRPNSWILSKSASPGNLGDLEDVLFAGASGMSSSPIVLAVKLSIKNDQRMVGISFADATSRVLGVAEFIDNELYSNLESLTIQLSVKECLVPIDESKKDYELNKMKGMLDRCGVVLTECKKGDFQIKDVEQDLNRLMGDGVSVASLPQFELKNAMAACSCLIKYLALLSDESNFGEYSLTTHDLTQYMKLDAAAVAALNLMPGPNDGANKTMSLFGLLNKCKTSQGTRLLGQWLKQPLMNLTEIEKRYNILQSFMDDTEVRQTLQDDILKVMPDLHRLAKRFQKGNASLQDVVRIYQVVIRLPSFFNAFDSFTGDDESKTILEETYVTKIKEYYQHLSKLQEMVEETIDLEAVEQHEFKIKSDFDDTLKELHQQLEEIKNGIEPEAFNVSRRLNLELNKKLKVEKNSIYGYHLRLSRQDSTHIRNKSEYIELATQKAGVLFTTSKLRELSNRFMSLSSEYEKQQGELVKELIGIVATYSGVMEQLNSVIAHLDVLVSFAHVSLHAPTTYVRPKLFEQGNGNIILKDARHPCLEVQDDVSFIANDVEMIRDQSEFQIITGPNCGGKSTYIRQIGVIALMAQIGCFVPCSSAELCIVDSILARVGAGDSQLKGVSTFMAEMLETAAILKSATSSSLIIIDELGRGTSTYDGFGLAYAISEHIAKNIKCFALFATHFHELTSLSEEISTVKNLHVVAHIGREKEITLLYKVKEGICDQSFGIHVAEITKFPESLVKLAKRKADELEDFSQSDRATKCPKEVVEEGTNVIESFLSEFSGTENIDSMKEEQVIDVIQNLKEKYWHQFEQNEFVMEVVNGL